MKSSLLDKFGGGKTEADKQFENDLSELEKSFGPLAGGCKDSLLKEMSKISLGTQPEHDIEPRDANQSGINLLSSSQSSLDKKGLIEEVSSTEKKLDEPECHLEIQEKDEELPRRFMLKIKLPGIKSVKDCDLDISEVKSLCIIFILCTFWIFWCDRLMWQRLVEIGGWTKHVELIALFATRAPLYSTPSTP